MALAQMASSESDIEVEGISGKEKRMISTGDLFNYIEPRVQEIMSLCKQEMARMGYTSMPPGGVVLTGGVSLMSGISELAGEVFNCPVRIAQPSYLGVKSPIYSTAVGLIHYIYRYRDQGLRRMGKRQDRRSTGFLSNLWKRIKHFIAEIWE